MSKVCCFTGHREFKLTRPREEVVEELSTQILKAHEEGYTTFITGMAQGVDIWAGEIVKKIKGARLIAAIPFPGFESRWSPFWESKYKKLLEKVDWEVYICPEYNKTAYQKRNIWMVDNADLVIAVFNHKPGGTWNTIKYAREVGKEVRLIEG